MTTKTGNAGGIILLAIVLMAAAFAFGNRDKIGIQKDNEPRYIELYTNISPARWVNIRYWVDGEQQQVHHDPEKNVWEIAFPAKPGQRIHFRVDQGLVGGRLLCEIKQNKVRKQFTIIPSGQDPCELTHTVD